MTVVMALMMRIRRMLMKTMMKYVIEGDDDNNGVDDAEEDTHFL